MFKGFYNLTSGMLTQQQNLDVVSHNLVNISTAGYKEERYTASTFDEVMLSRVGNVEKIYTEIGEASSMRVGSQMYTNYDQGVPEFTGIPLDFAIYGDGFFAIQGADGQMTYTRSGTFALDEEGYLCYPGQGRVMNRDNEPILLSTDKVKADSAGRIFTEAGGLLGELGVFVFEDNEALVHNGDGMFTGEGAAPVENPVVDWQYVERSNVDMVRQMTEMLTCQRALQSAAQVAKMYDQLMSKASNDIGRL